MEAQQKLGSVGTAIESYSAGVASASVAAALPQTAWGLSVSLQATSSLDASVLIAYLAGKIGGPIPAEVASFLELALKST